MSGQMQRPREPRPSVGAWGLLCLGQAPGMFRYAQPPRRQNPYPCSRGHRRVCANGRD